jgi:Trk K+ transport system NAD-binding subunit
VVCGNGLEERTLARTEPDTRRGCVAVTANESVNLLFARKVREEHRVPTVLAAVERGKPGVSPEAVAGVGAGRPGSRRGGTELGAMPRS